MKLYKIVIVGLVLVMFVGCSGPKNSVVVNSQDKELTNDEILNFKYSFSEAGRLMLHGDLDNALMLYNKCVAIDPSSSTSFYKIATIYWYKQDYAASENSIDKALKINSTNTYYLEFAGNVYLKNNKIDKAVSCFNRLIELEPGNINYFLAKADAYYQAGDVKSVIKIYDEVEDLFGITEMVSLRKHKLFISQNNKKEAVNELVKLADSTNEIPDYKRLLAEYYVQTGDVDKAIVNYNAVLKDFPDDGYSFIGLAECYRVKGDYPQAFVQLKHAFISQEIESSVKLELLSNLYQASGTDLTLQTKIAELLTILIEQYPDDVNVNMLYADFLLRLGNLAEARVIIRKVVKEKKDTYSLWEQLMYLENEFTDWENMYSESKEALTYFPNQSLLYFFNGFSAFQLDYLEESVASFEFGFRLITQDDPLKKDYLMFLGEANHKLGNKDKAYEYFDKLLTVDPENIAVLNNYAYYLSLDLDKLEKALTMSEITVTKEPYNSTYLDTYAWILFRQDEFSKALEFIEKAVKYNSDSSDVIVEHYGDILYKNNQVEEAVLQWNNALKLGEGSGNIKRKIDAKKYLE